MKTKPEADVNTYVTVLLALLLSACASTRPVDVFDGQLPDSEVATLVSEQVVYPNSNKPLVYMRSVDGIRFGKATVVRLLPGAHGVETECLVGQFSGTLLLKNGFEAGHTYEVYCVDEGKNALISSRDLGIGIKLPLLVKKP